MKGMRRGVIFCVMFMSLVFMAGCSESENAKSGNTSAPAPKESVSEQEVKEKYISMPENIGVSESLIAFNQTGDGSPLIYTIGQKGTEYYYTKYVFEDDKWLSEKAEFQDQLKKVNSEMLAQRVFMKDDFLYLVNAVILDKEKNTYELFLYRYDKDKDKLKKIKFDKLSYTDETTKAKYDMFDMQFIDDKNFAAAYNSGKLLCYNLDENTSKEYTGQIYGNFKVYDNKLFTGDLANKKITCIDLQSLNVCDEIEIDLQESGYNFCTYGDEIYVGCKNGIFALNGTEAEKLIDGTGFSTYALDDNSKVIALCRDNKNFYMLFAQGNSYKFYSYPVVEGG